MQCTVIINKLKNNYSNRLLDRSTILNRFKKNKTVSILNYLDTWKFDFA